MTTISFIGDVHGEYADYLKLIRDCEYSVQLGDFGFRFDEVADIDTDRHRFIPGNHEKYPLIKQRKLDGWRFPVDHDYGILHLAGAEIMYVRGGYSVDKMYRRPGFDWFPEEELSDAEFETMIERLSKERTKIAASHECPGFVGYEVYNANPYLEYEFGRYHPSRTARALEALFTAMDVKPELWVFGHHHVSFDQTIHGTRFVCVPTLGHFDWET